MLAYDVNATKKVELSCEAEQHPENLQRHNYHEIHLQKGSDC